MKNTKTYDVKIYQIEDVAATPYAFRGWGDNKDLFTPKMQDYKEVAHFTRDAQTVVEVLDLVFELGNCGTLQQLIPGMRSVSVSDIIEVDGMRFYVDSFGFTALGKVIKVEEA